MKLHDIAFYVAGFFLLGILAASIFANWLFLFLLSALVAAIFLLSGILLQRPKMFWLSAFSMFIALGGFYYLADDAQFKNANIIFNQKAEFRVVIVSDPKTGVKNQNFIAQLQPPYSGNILVKLGAHPKFSYGDLLKVEGIIKNPFNESYAQRLAKDRISGVIDFPKIEIVNHNNGGFVKASLFNIKNSAIETFNKVLPPQKSAFLAGITLGQRSSFSKEFEEAMSLSGTTHLVALSGYNVSVIIAAVGLTLGRLLKRRWQFFWSVILILGFVMMTGAEASIVRAAIMGIIFLLSQQTDRVYSFRNAITFAALIMAVVNPKVLAFDLGFQLSFLALLGIVYLKPALITFFKINTKPTLFSWKDNALTTIAAQLAVLPLLLSNFGIFSPASIIANILILEVMPVTMFLGFLVMSAGFLSNFLATVIGFLANIFLSYEILVINLFSKLKFAVMEVQNFGLILSAIYFGILLGFILYAKKIEKKSFANL